MAVSAEKPKPESILATDVGSTTTKAILIEKRGDEYRLITRGEMPTTVEAPWDNVMIGVRKAVRRVSELIERPLLDESGHLIRPKQGNRGVDMYVSTSSAGGGLQMMVGGLVSAISATSAHRAALGAGAVVLDVIAVDDGRSTSEQITRISELRPDIVLISGGVDGGSVTYLAALTETVMEANPQPRFGMTYKLPFIYAGNKDAADMIQDMASKQFAVHVVDNLRPSHDVENLGPARQAIHDIFMNHVMAQAPGYHELMEWVDTQIMPTPGAVGSLIALMAKQYGINIIGVDIGGATTDVFSDFGGTFTRTVSANLGMSYSITNVLEEAGFENIRRWVPFGIDEESFSNWISNKMVRPTTIPQTWYHLMLEQALAREALRLSFEHHKSLARKVEKTEDSMAMRTRTELFASSKGVEVIDMMKLHMLVGSGGVLSHAPRRSQAALMLMDSFQPQGVTELTVDSIFMMPHLGVLGSVYPDIAAEVFDKDCLVRLGTLIAPAGRSKEGRPVATVHVSRANGTSEDVTVRYGEIVRLPLGVGETAHATVTPDGAFDMGAGKGKKVDVELHGGLVGIIIDGRGRPIEIPTDEAKRVERVAQWIHAMEAYPDDVVQKYINQYAAKPAPAASKSERNGGQERGGLFNRLLKR